MLGDQIKIQDPLKAMAGFRAEFIPAGTTHNGLWPPESALKIDVGGIQRHSGRFATHDTGQAFHTIIRGNNTNIWFERNGLSVQQFKLLARFGPADRQAALYALQVENKGRQLQLKPDIYGDNTQRNRKS